MPATILRKNSLQNITFRYLQVPGDRMVWKQYKHDMAPVTPHDRLGSTPAY
jgi:hypothetical protein